MGLEDEVRSLRYEVQSLKGSQQGGDPPEPPKTVFEAFLRRITGFIFIYIASVIAVPIVLAAFFWVFGMVMPGPANGIAERLLESRYFNVYYFMRAVVVVPVIISIKIFIKDVRRIMGKKDK